MRFVTLLITFASLVLAGTFTDYRREDHVESTEMAGGPHGDAFDDFRFVNAASGHRRISKLTMGPCNDWDAVTYLKFEFMDWKNPKLAPTVSEHGKLKNGAITKSLNLPEGHTIAYVNVRVSKVRVGFSKYKTRVIGLSFSNGVNDPVTCGVKDDSKAPYDWSADADRAFLYFSGGQGEVIDNIVGHTIPLNDFY